ncbi:MAG: DUF962 domain-containing protein [Rhodospirillaceae bacterium]|nr:DUF962 domain-containing protein [Rhodospirillaceae bacterium]
MTDSSSAPARGRIASYRAFWPFYVGEHRHAWTRRLHFIGTLGALGTLVAAAAWGEPWILLAAPVCGYGFAWASHVLIEKNRPATFQYPLWSLIGDFRMAGLVAVGRMQREVDKVVGARRAKPD